MQYVSVATRWRCCTGPQSVRSAWTLSLLSAAAARRPPRSVVALKSVQTSDFSAEELQSALTDVKATRETLRSTSAGFLFILRDYLEICYVAPHPAVTKPQICSNLGDYFGSLSLSFFLFYTYQ